MPSGKYSKLLAHELKHDVRYAFLKQVSGNKMYRNSGRTQAQLS